MENEMCVNCRFSVQDGTHVPQLECHLNAPCCGFTIGRVATAWPKVQPDDWCGEWKTIPTP